MGFWTSSEPGVLPKWIFWAFAIWLPIDLILVAEEAATTGGSPRAFPTVIIGYCAWCAHKNKARILVWIHLIGAVAAFGSALLWRSALPQTLERTGFEDASTGLFITSAVLSTLFAIYLNQFSDSSHKKNPPAISPSEGSPRAYSYSVPKESSPDDYANELCLFEAGDLDQSLWAKHLVEAEGDAEKAKWRYLKERVGTAPARRAEQERVKEEEENRRRDEEKQKAAEEERKAKEEREARLEEIALARIRKHEESERAGLAVKPTGSGFLPILFCIAILVILISL